MCVSTAVVSLESEVSGCAKGVLWGENVEVGIMLDLPGCPLIQLKVISYK